MKPIKFKYIFSNGKEFKNTILTLKEIENGQLKAFTNNIPCSFKLIATCQFTGEEDKNGVDIFKGDIIHSDTYNENFEISFDDACFTYIISRADYNYLHEISLNRSKVIGNIYENKELLEEERCFK
ncbi:MAG: YopX family protein [Arcobacter sp.]|uniref:YopX family protein n=1 Tax=Arcobacter sp. TaxID=1872629 RepID=UPI003C74281D